MDTNMTTKTLLDEYAGCFRVVDSCESDAYICEMCKGDEKRMQEIAQELEASIRKEVVMKLETYFGHVLNDGTGKPIQIELEQLAYEVIKIIKE